MKKEIILSFMELAKDTAVHNAEFAEDALTEVVELLNDVIDLLKPLLSDMELYLKSALANAVVHIVMPLSYGIFVDCLLGNLPACFMQLRTMTEAIVKAYYADMAEIGFFESKLELFERFLREKKVSPSKVFKWLEEVSPEASKMALRIWGRCSENWVHPRGLFKRIVDTVVKHKAPPAFALAIPMYYGEEDQETLSELKENLVDFRNLLRMIIEL
jgi:hypothetical protein